MKHLKKLTETKTNQIKQYKHRGEHSSPEKGITLIALIITIIILVILAAVTINVATNTGIIGYGFNATNKYKEEEQREKNILDNMTALVGSTRNDDYESLKRDYDSLLARVEALETNSSGIELLAKRIENIEDNHSNGVKLISQKWEIIENLTLNSNTWNNWISVPLAGNDSGYAIISYSGQCGDAAAKNMRIRIRDTQGAVLAFDGERSDGPTESASCSCVCRYDENTIIYLDIYCENNNWSPRTSYSILLIPDL